jgi:hypothetical protein
LAKSLHRNRLGSSYRRLSENVEGTGAAAEATAGEAQIDLLYRQIGQLNVESDFSEQRLGK